MSLQPVTAEPLTPAAQTETVAVGLKPNGQSPSGSPSHSPARLPRARRWSGRAKLLLALAIVLGAVGVGGAGYYVIAQQFKNARTDLILHKVHYGSLELTIVERGALESANNHDIVCRVKAKSQQSQNSSTIKSMVDNGSQVKKGDLLVELDDSGLIDQLKTQKITVDQKESDKIKAEEDYKIQVSQNESDIKNAMNTLELANIDLEKYQRGDFPQKLKDVDGRIKIAESNLEQQRDRAAWAQRMLKKGYYTVSQSDAEQSNLQSKELELAKVLEEKRVLVDPKYGDKKRTETDYTNKLEEAKRSLERIKGQARAKEVQSRTARDTAKLVFEQERDKYKDLEDEIRKCRIYAPIDGLVVYFVAEQARWGVGRQAVVAQGESVSENQKLMQIPDLKHMLVTAKVHEAMVSRVQKGQPASVRVDAMNNRRLKAHVQSVANTASQQDFFASDVKVYETKVMIDDEVEGLKPGMTGEVTITIEDALEHVLTVPIQAIIGSAEMGETRKCFVMTPQGPEERPIVVGMSNDKEAEITSGLKEGDEVVTNPKVLVGDKVKTREAGELSRKDTNGNGGPERSGKGGGKRGGPGGKGPEAMAPVVPQVGGPQPGGEGFKGKAGGQKGSFQMTPEMRKQWEDKAANYKKASPEKRKELLSQEDENARPFIKQGLERQGIKIPD